MLKKGSDIVKNNFDNKDYQHTESFFKPVIQSTSQKDPLVYDLNTVSKILEKINVSEDAPVYGEPRYAGRIFDVFILIEWGDNLFIIDQHAAHERILYNSFISGQIPKQDLLVPITFSTESDDDDKFLQFKKEELANLGIVLEKDGSLWRIDALPAGWKMSDSETINKILDLKNAKENMAERWAASLSCHQAVKENDYLDEKTALELAKCALVLPQALCPHGRPLWTQITKEALYRAVKRS